MIPNLATEWDVNTDELSITWTLREGVNFADGEPFNAEAVKRNIEEYQANNRTETANIASCEVIDDTHIKMMMAEPNSSTLESVGFFVYYMSPKALENPSSLDAATCGTGPFQLSEFENNAYAIYTKNENYWKEGLPYLDSVEVTLVTESSTANTAFQANEYDMYWVGLANPTILQQLDGAGIYVKEDNQNGMGVESLGLIPNSAIDGPWADARVRRALCYAIDVDAINAAFLMGMAQMTDQWAVPGSATYNDSPLIDLVESSATAELGENAVRHISQPFSGSEDFSFFGKLTSTPCAFMMIDAGHGENQVSLHNGKIVFDGVVESAKTALANGIPVGLGNDVGCPYITQYDFWRELCYFHKYCGVSNRFALYTATLRNAQLAGIGDVTGSIAPGKSADFIVTRKNPLEDLRALQHLELVVCRGRAVKKPSPKRRKEVDALLDPYLV